MIVSFDPSVNHIGWATFDDCMELDEWNAWEWGVINLSTYEALSNKLKFLQYEFIERDWRVDRFGLVVFEKPTFFDVERGRIAARNDYTINMGIIIGFIAGRLAIPIRMYSPATWKGTMTKEMTRSKLERKFGLTRAKSKQLFKTDHEVDAMMLLYFHLAERKKEKQM